MPKVQKELNPVYPFVFMDCIHYKVREDGRILSRTAYIVLGVTVDGHKAILSITVGANESSKFWLGMLNDLNMLRYSFKYVNYSDLKNSPLTLRQYTMRQMRRLPCQSLMQSEKSGGKIPLCDP